MAIIETQKKVNLAIIQSSLDWDTTTSTWPTGKVDLNHPVGRIYGGGKINWTITTSSEAITDYLKHDLCVILQARHT